jgi:D-alanyl-D-alanine carboxypeptidase
MRLCRFLLVFTVALAPMTAGARAPQTPADAAIAREAQRALDAVSDPAGPGAAVLITRGDRTIFRSARGLADIELGVRLTPDQTFRVASVTKIFTAALILQLAETAALSLDDPLTRFLPDFPNGGQITIRQLLSHSAGISDRPVDLQPAAPGRDRDMATLVAEIARRPSDFPPGTQQAYSNAGYILLGAVIERVTGKPWYAAMRERLFGPLGLRHTDLDQASALIAGRVSGYETDGATHLVTNARFMNMTGPASAGALVSTVDDLRSWIRALAAGRVIGGASFRQMMTPVIPGSGPTRHPYGFGLYVWQVRGETMIGHTGQINGFASILAWLPARDITIVALANDDNFDARTFGRRLAAIALGRPYPLVRATPVDAATLQALAGSYRITATETETLSVRDGRLYAQRSGRNAIPLQMAADGRLYFVPDELTYLAPVRDAAGAVVRLDYVENGEEPTQSWPRIPATQ